MKTDYNSKAFTPEEVKQGLLKDLINYLIGYNTKSKEDYYDIHITTDGYCTIVEWTDVMYDNNLGEQGRFKFVDSNEVVMFEGQFPDNHYEMCYDEEDYQERLKNFLKDNPGWVKNQWGCWTNEIENEQFRKQFEDSCPCEDNQSEKKDN